jgi:tol-pal system protein YbgF
MPHWCPDVLKPAALACAVLALVGPAWAQPAVDQTSPGPSGSGSERLDSLQRDTQNFFGRMFGQPDRPADHERAPVSVAQMSAPDLAVRLERLENEIRQLTGIVEQLQYRNQQLEQQLRRLGGDPTGAGAPPRVSQGTPAAPQMAAPPPVVAAPPVAPEPPAASGPTVIAAAPPAPPGAIPRRGDAFDPSQNPGAPGAPRALGAVPSNAAPPPAAVIQEDPGYVGAPGGRQAGAPLDLSPSGAAPSGDPAALPAPGMSGPLPPPPPRNPNATGAQQMVMAPSNAPKDEYDLAYGYVLRKDYALAEDAFRAFLKKHPSDRLTPDAHYWLGETLFQRQRYRDAAESFLTVSTKYETASKAPDALLRLGQSLAALNEKEAACATLGEIGRKYPRASVTVKQGVEREQKRVHC